MDINGVDKYVQYRQVYMCVYSTQHAVFVVTGYDDMYMLEMVYCYFLCTVSAGALGVWLWNQRVAGSFLGHCQRGL